METVLKPVLNEFAFVYLDDVIITSPSFHQHLEHLDKDFTLLKNAGFLSILKKVTAVAAADFQIIGPSSVF